MKNLILFISIIFSFNASSQINKGNWLIGGQGFYNFSKSNELKLSSIYFSPRGGYFFLDKLAAGISLNYSSETYNGSDKRRFVNYSVGPFIRYYFLPNQEKVNFLLDASYAYAYGKHRNLTFETKNTFNHSIATLQAGPAIFLNNNTAFEVLIGYGRSTRGPIDSTLTNSLRIGIGLQFHLTKKRD